MINSSTYSKTVPPPSIMGLGFSRILGLETSHERLMHSLSGGREATTGNASAVRRLKGLPLDTYYDDNFLFMINLGGGDIILCECFTL